MDETMMKGETDIEFMRCDQEKEISPEEKNTHPAAAGAGAATAGAPGLRPLHELGLVDPTAVPYPPEGPPTLP